MSSKGPARRGLLLVVSAPSGTGKTTVVERLVQVTQDLALSRSYTSRSVRPGETDGIDYNFITRTRFEAMVAADAFLEWADVFGNLYGTCAEDAERELAAGRDLVLVIDVQGARQVRARCPGTVGVFVLPPSLRGARAAAARPQQGFGRSHAAPVAHGAGRSGRVRRVRLRGRERRARALRRADSGRADGRAGAAAIDADRRRRDRRDVRSAKRSKPEVITGELSSD